MSTLTRFLLGAIVVPALASCGGGGGAGGGLAFNGGTGGSGDETGVGGSGGVVGTAQGFGSIIINDLKMDIDDATFQIEGQGAGMGLVGQNQLSEGQQLVLLGDIDALKASDVFYRSDVKGRLEAAPTFDPLTGVGDLTVVGQTVRVNATTRYARGAALDTLAPNDELEISGVRDANGTLVATYVALEDNLTEYKVVGRVSAVTATGFALGNLVIDAGGLMVPASGALVEVRLAAAAYVPGVPALATAVEPLSGLQIEEGERLEVEGFINTFVSASEFSVNGFDVVVPAGARFDKGSAADLGLNVRVEVEGRVNVSGDLQAERIIFKPTEAIRVEAVIAGGGIDLTARRITTAVDVTFQVRQATEIEDDSAANVEPFDLENLAPGDFLEIRGFLDGDDLVAAEIEREDFDTGAATRFRAPADAAPTVDGSGNLRLTLLGVAITADGSTRLADADGVPVSDLQAFALLVGPGTVVEASWTDFTSTVDVVAELSIEEDD